MKEYKKEYALYKDDEFICIGTLKEIADYLEVTYRSILSYKSKKRCGYIFLELGKKGDNENE
jgi:hypothetical protein